MVIYLGFSFPLWGLIFRQTGAGESAEGLHVAPAAGDRGSTGPA